MKSLLLFIFLLGLSVQKYSACSSTKQKNKTSYSYKTSHIAVGGPVLVRVKSKA